MKKKFSMFFALATLFVVLPSMVNADTVVRSEQELLEALKTNEETIVLGGNIETTQKINVVRDATIDGAGYTISYTGKFYDKNNGVWVEDNTVWSSPEDNSGAAYVIQVYMSNVTLKNIGLVGGNRGLAVNGGKVNLEGSIIFGNNGFEPIELSHGRDVPTINVSTLVVNEETLIVNLDSSSMLYVDDQDAKLTKLNGELSKNVDLQNGTLYNSDEVNVNLVYHTDDENLVSSEEFINAKKNNQNLVFVKLDDEGNIIYGWEFNSKDITANTNVDLNTIMLFSKNAPDNIKENLEKITKGYKNVSYLTLEHEGLLPGTADIYHNVSSVYEAGTKLLVARFNEDTGKLEEAFEATVDENGCVEFLVTEGSSYVLYTEIENTTNNTEVNPPKTGDINLYIIISLVIISAIGTLIASKKIVSKVK